MVVALIAATPGADAQPAAKPAQVGVLRLDKPPRSRSLEDLRQGLRELGYVEGQNLVLQVRWAEGRLDRLPELAAELVRLT